MIPAQAPCEGGEPTRRKGSYSEESVGKNTIGMVSCNDVLKLRAAEEKRPQIKGHRDEPVADDHCFTLVVERTRCGGSAYLSSCSCRCDEGRV